MLKGALILNIFKPGKWFSCPATYIACGKNKRLISIFLDEAQKRKSAKAAHMDVKLFEIDTYFYEEL